MKRLARSVVVALVVACAAAMPARAGALDDRVPGDSLVYVGWAGADAMAAQYKGSNLQQILDASALASFLNREIPKLIAKAEQADPDAPKKIEMVKQGLGIAWRHPVAFYFCPVDFANPEKPGLRFGMICDAGADAKTLNDLLAPLVESAPPNADVQVRLSQENGVTLLTFGKPETLAELKAGGALAANPAYVKAMGQVKQTNPALSFYGDVKGILAVVNDGLAKVDAPPEAKTRIPAVIAALGLNSMTQIASVSGFEGKSWSDRKFVGLDGPRTGIISLFDTTPVTDAMLSVVPKDAAAFSAGRFDLQKTWGEIRRIITTVEPRALQEIDRGVAEINRELGLNIETDIINLIGDEWVIYRAPAGEKGLTYALVNKPKDGPALAKSLETLEKMFNEKSEAPIHVEKVKTDKIEVSAVMFLQYNVAWTVRGGYLYVSTLDGIGPAVRQIEEKRPSIATSDLYKGVMTTLTPAGVKPNAVSYNHPARVYPELRSLLLGVIPLIRTVADIDVPMNLLPDPADVADFMPPGGMVSWSDDQGIHVVANSAFPGAAILAGQQMESAALAGIAGAGLIGVRATHAPHAVVNLP